MTNLSWWHELACFVSSFAPPISLPLFPLTIISSDNEPNLSKSKHQDGPPGPVWFICFGRDRFFGLELLLIKLRYSSVHAILFVLFPLGLLNSISPSLLSILCWVSKRFYDFGDIFSFPWCFFLLGPFPDGLHGLLTQIGDDWISRSQQTSTCLHRMLKAI